MKTHLSRAQRKAIVRRSDMDEARHIGSLTDPKHAKWKPVKKKTAAELLEKHDEGKIKLTPEQREWFVERAGKAYKPASKKRATVGNSKDPLARLKGETVEQYLARLKEMFS